MDMETEVDRPMRTDQERIALLHQRAAEIREKRERAKTRAWGAAPLALLLCLLNLTAAALKGGHGISAETAAASSLLAESAGGYVLTVVAAFMLGVGTMALKNHRK